MIDRVSEHSLEYFERMTLLKSLARGRYRSR